MTLNIDNLNKVYAWLHKGAPEVIFSMKYALRPIEETDVTDRDYFDEDEGYYALARSQQEKVDAGGCGSVCCIAGAAAQFDGVKVNDPDYEDWTPIQNRALTYFGIDPNAYDNIPWMLPVFDPDLAPPNCGPRTAAKALKLWADHVAAHPKDIEFNPWSHIE